MTTARKCSPNAVRMQRAAIAWDRVGQGQKMKDNKSKSVVERQCRGLQGEGHDGK